MSRSSTSVSGCKEVFGGVEKVNVGRLMLRSAWRPGIELIVVRLNEAHGLICLISHQKCLVFMSRT